MFNLFRKKNSGPIREFHSDADKFTTEDIWKWMEECYSSDGTIPPLRDDSYTKSLIDKMSEEGDIEILDDTQKNGVRTIMLGISRNGTDYVSIAYQLFNPNVVYITTSPYGFAGGGKSFMLYSNSFQKEFPMISIGVLTHDRQIKFPDGEIGIMKDEMYTVRTLIPLLGNEQDYTNLLTATRCLPIYGYDLRDGYHSNAAQPYASRKTGINIQLEKIVKIHEFKKTKGLYPGSVQLYGGAPFVEYTTDEPASISNPCLQYYNFCANGTNKFIGNSSNRIEYFRIAKDDASGSMKRSGITQLVCYNNYPTLYTIEANELITIAEEQKLDDLIEYMAKISASSINSNPQEYALYKATLEPHGDDNNVFLLTVSMTQSLPNQVDAKTIAFHIAAFFESIKLRIDEFNPSSEDCK